VSNDWLLLEVADNPVIWGIVALALFCYVVEFDLILSLRDAQWKRRSRTWLKVLPVLLNALPLLGLLGTVNGMLQTFRAAGSTGLTDQSFVSGGIADALITTQLGLITAVPGLLLYAYLRSRHRAMARA